MYFNWFVFTKLISITIASVYRIPIILNDSGKEICIYLFFSMIFTYRTDSGFSFSLFIEYNKILFIRNFINHPLLCMGAIILIFKDVNKMYLYGREEKLNMSCVRISVQMFHDRKAVYVICFFHTTFISFLYENRSYVNL